MNVKTRDLHSYTTHNLIQRELLVVRDGLTAGHRLLKLVRTCPLLFSFQQFVLYNIGLEALLCSYPLKSIQCSAFISLAQLDQCMTVSKVVAFCALVFFLVNISTIMISSVRWHKGLHKTSMLLLNSS